jgi:hypothetical protein
MKRTSSRRSEIKMEEEEEKIDYGHSSSEKKRHVILTMAKSNPEDKEEKEVVESVTVGYDEEGNIRVNSIIESLKKLGYLIKDSMVSYYSNSKKVYVYIGNYPLSDKVIPNGDVDQDVKIKIRPKAKSIFGDFLLGNTNASISKGSRRTKERKIGDVIKKVAEWRRLYNGIEEEGEIIKKSLEEAAKQVGISKKSLDDYLLQLRNGRKYGFNFNEHKDDKIGILRAFNRKHKNIDKDNKKSKPGRKPNRH